MTRIIDRWQGLALDLKAGAVRILQSDGKTTSGAGFVVSDKGLLATCSHVVQPEASQNRAEPRPEKVYVIFCATGERMAAAVLPEFWRPADREDLAILQLEGDLPAAVKPLPLGSSKGTSNHAFQTFGFPEFGPEEGTYGDGHILNELQMHTTKVLQVSSPQITPGFSGGPVLDMVTGRIVGMVTAIVAPDKYGRMAETAYITPTEALREICPPLGLSDIQPYMGLAAFSEKDAEFFFGRRKTVEALAEALRSRPRFLLVMGPSGSGKSSVVQAGLILWLRKGAVPVSDRWGILVARPSDRPFDQLEAEGLEGASKGLAWATGLWLKKQTRVERMLLVLDQFEEFLVTCPPLLRHQFWAGLQDLLDCDLPITIMTVMRDDFYSRFAQEAPPQVLDWIKRGVFPVSASLEREELREIIEQPARQVGLALEEGLAQVVINDVLESCQEEGGRAGRSTVLPLLEFALTQVWERREQGFLTHQAYNAVGKVTGSLTAWADQVCRSLENDGLGQLTRRIFTDLVNLGDGAQRLPDSRRRRLLDDLCNQQEEREPVHRIVQRLADARLVTTSTDKGQVTVEIIHDSLIREWSRLQRWLKKDRSFLSWERELEKDARDWKDTSPEDVARRDEGRLLRGLRLNEAERWLTDREADLGSDEIELINASIQSRDKARLEREKQREEKEQIRRQMIRGLAAFSLIVLILALSAGGLWLKTESLANQITIQNLAAQSEVLREIPGSLIESAKDAVASLNGRNTPEGDLALRRMLALQHRAVAVMKHEDQVRSIAFSPDGKMLATGCDDGKVRLWNASTGDNLSDHPLLHNYWIRSIAFSPDGERLATGCDDGNVRIWDIYSDQKSIPLPHNTIVNSVAFSPDGKKLASGDNSGDIRIWNISNLNDKSTIDELLDLSLADNVKILSVAFSPDGKRLAAALINGSIRVWNASTGDLMLQTSQIHSDWVHSVAFSPNGTLLATGSRDFKAKILNASTGKDLISLDHGNSVVESVAFSPDGKMLATASNNDNTARIWDFSSRKVVARMEHNAAIREGWVRAVAFSPNGKRVATASNDRTAIVWDIDTSELACIKNNNSVDSIALSPDGTRLASASEDGSVKVWNFSAGKFQFNPLNYDKGVISIVFSPDGKKLATGCRDGNASILDSANGKNLTPLLEHNNNSVNFVAFSPDGTKLATVSDDQTCTVWDASTGKEIIKLPHEAKVSLIAFSRDGKWLATASRDAPYGEFPKAYSIIKVWNLHDWSRLFSYSMDGGNINTMEFSPDGTKLAIGGQTGAGELLDVNNAVHPQLFDMRKLIWQDYYDVYGMNFSPDGTKLAVTGMDRKIWIVDVFTGKLLSKLNLSGWGFSVSFSPDGTKIANACDDHAASIWDVSTKKEISRMQHDDSVSLVAFSKDGIKLATGSKDGTARVWYLRDEDLICEACRRLDKITDDKWKAGNCSCLVSSQK